MSSKLNVGEDLTKCYYGDITDKEERHKYNFKNLEYQLQSSYNNFLTDFDNAAYFQQFYKDLYVITFGILETTKQWVRQDLNHFDIAHVYSTKLIERILGNLWRSRVNEGEDKFSWCSYIRLNIRDTIYGEFITRHPERNISLDDLVEVFESTMQGVDSADTVSNVNQDFSEFVNLESSKLIETESYDKNLAVSCTKFLILLFGEDKYYSLVSKLLSLKVKNYDDMKDKELRSFTKISLVLFKRLFEDYNLNNISLSKVDKVFNSSLFLASIMSSNLDKSLFVSLDLSNLYRLSMACGGKKVRIPKLKEIEYLISTAKISYDVLSSNLEDTSKLNKIRDKIRKEFDIYVRSDMLSKNVHNILKYLSTNITDSCADDDPIIKSLVTLSSRSDTIINKILDKLETSIDNVNDNEDLVSIYKEMMGNLTLSLNLMTNIRNLFESEFTKNFRVTKDLTGNVTNVEANGSTDDVEVPLDSVSIKVKAGRGRPRN